jgi:tetratricopeptide (TPR) repeat protein
LVAAGQGSEALDALLCSVVGWHRQGDTRQVRASCIVWEQTAKDMALVAGDPRWGDFWRLRGVLARDGGQLERAEECFHIALRGAELHGWSTITCVLTSLGHLAALRHEPALAESFHRRALATADALGDPAWALHARSVVAILWAQQGRLQEASVLLREAVGLGDHTSQGHALSDALESLASATMMQGELALARSYAQKAKRDDQPAPQACPVQSCVLAQ